MTVTTGSSFLGYGSQSGACETWPGSLQIHPFIHPSIHHDSPHPGDRSQQAQQGISDTVFGGSWGDPRSDQIYNLSGKCRSALGSCPETLQRAQVESQSDAEPPQMAPFSAEKWWFIIYLE